MEDFKLRLLTEKEQLLGKLEKLNLFLTSEKFKDLPTIQQNLLVDQQYHMQKYHDILVKRINLLGI